MTTPVLDTADATAGERMLAVTPTWAGITAARELIGTDRVLLHAGPAFDSWAQVPVPVRNSMALACVYEGWATAPATAFDLLASGAVRFRPAQDHDMVVPLAGVISPSMALHVVADPATGRVKYAALNEGMRHCLRLGVLDPEIPAFHRWLNGPYAAWLAGRCGDGVALLDVLAESLVRGDDGHSRTVAGSALFAERLVDSGTPSEIADFLADCPAFALNLWMGAAALILGAAEGVSGSRIVTRAGGNGVRFGFQLAERPGVWHTAPADAPRGPVEPAHAGHGAVGAIGDSAVVDVLGLGGQSLAGAPAVAAGLDGYLPGDALERPARLLPLELLDGRLRTGLSTRTIAAAGVGPLVLLGMISDTGRGRIGGGVYQPAVEVWLGT